MKKLMGIIVLMSVIFIYGCCGCGDYKYTINDCCGNSYYTNQYSVKNGCVIFLDEFDDKCPITLCGTYSITENKSYKPEKK